MTRRHFEAFARMICERREALAGPFGCDAEAADIAVREMAGLVCDIARQFNPRFDRNRFMKAAGFDV